MFLTGLVSSDLRRFIVLPLEEPRQRAHQLDSWADRCLHWAWVRITSYRQKWRTWTYLSAICWSAPTTRLVPDLSRWQLSTMVLMVSQLTGLRLNLDWYKSDAKHLRLKLNIKWYNSYAKMLNLDALHKFVLIPGGDWLENSEVLHRPQAWRSLFCSFPLQLNILSIFSHCN